MRDVFTRVFGCNGLETCTNQAPTGYLCTSPLPHAECPIVPPECGQSGGYHGPSNILSDTIDSAFRLYDTQSWDTTSARLDELEEAIDKIEKVCKEMS